MFKVIFLASKTKIKIQTQTCPVPKGVLTPEACNAFQLPGNNNCEMKLLWEPFSADLAHCWCLTNAECHFYTVLPTIHLELARD